MQNDVYCLKTELLDDSVFDEDLEVTVERATEVLSASRTAFRRLPQQFFVNHLGQGYWLEYFSQTEANLRLLETLVGKRRAFLSEPAASLEEAARGCDELVRALWTAQDATSRNARELSRFLVSTKPWLPPLPLVSPSLPLLVVAAVPLFSSSSPFSD